jgi:glutathione S-transferase
MAIDLYWSVGSPYCWRVQLALAYKGLAYGSKPLDLATQEHKSPQIRRLTPRGRVPVLTDADYVVFESVAVLYYLDRRYPALPLFGTSAEEGGVILRVIEEFQSYIEPHLSVIVDAIGGTGRARPADEVLDHLLTVAGEARVIEGRLAKSDWVVGERPSAADFVIYPWIELLRHALLRPAGAELRARFLPVEVQYPALARWLERVSALPGVALTRSTHLQDGAS